MSDRETAGEGVLMASEGKMSATLVGDLPETVIDAFKERSRRRETPCGAGSLVWRSWGEGPPLVLFHGGSGSWMHWIRNIDTLGRERTLWIPDLPGFGESADPPAPDHPSLSAVLAEGLRILLPDALPVDVAGFSFGGVVAAHLAGYHPDVVRRLVLVDTGGLGNPTGDVEFRGMRGLSAEQRWEANRDNLRAAMLKDPDSLNPLAIHIQGESARRALLNPGALVLPDRLLEALPPVTAQIDAIWGEHDQLHPRPDEQAAVLRSLLPRIDFRVIAGAGHWSMYDRPDAFNRTLLDLLSRPLRTD